MAHWVESSPKTEHPPGHPKLTRQKNHGHTRSTVAPRSACTLLSGSPPTPARCGRRPRRRRRPPHRGRRPPLRGLRAHRCGRPLATAAAVPSPAPQPARRCEGTRGRSSPASRPAHGHAGGKVARGRAPQPAPTLLVLLAIMAASDRWCSCRRLRPSGRTGREMLDDVNDQLKCSLVIFCFQVIGDEPFCSELH